MGITPRFISIVGAPGSGKTYFLTVMLKQLREDLARSFDCTLTVSDSHEKRVYSDYYNALFESEDKLSFLRKTQEGDLSNTVTIDGAEIELPKPFIFFFRPAKHAATTPSILSKPLSFILYDNPGEYFEFTSYKKGGLATKHLGESKAVLFAFDLLQDRNARQRLAPISNDPQVHQKERRTRQEDVLTEVIQRIRRHKNLSTSETIDADLLVCMQKYDVWKSLVPHSSNCASIFSSPELIDHTSIEYDRKHGVAALDVEEINAISLLIRQLLEDLCPEFVRTAESSFRHVRYFPVSALGCSPVEDGNLLKVRPNELKPFRVSDPMLWLLCRWSQIHRWRRNGENPKKAPVALTTIDRSGATPRLMIRTPDSPRGIHLDAGYARSTIIHPHTGLPLWIPDIEVEDEASDAQSSTGSNRSREHLSLGKNHRKSDIGRSWWSRLFGKS
ncbi:hypothetical protein [Posidoniimonas polymericola]|uniref:hypothetical protein n=1 Tax=Posidoniimonas polymericola TaxID=2528002 RepID=UPI0011B75458|nr:hypothetical protein [Posidoniimonas polymericola]